MNDIVSFRFNFVAVVPSTEIRAISLPQKSAYVLSLHICLRNLLNVKTFVSDIKRVFFPINKEIAEGGLSSLQLRSTWTPSRATSGFD